MANVRGPSAFALLRRGGVLFGLIAEAAWVYGLYRLVRRGTLVRDEAWLGRRFGRFAARFVRIATRFRGGLIKLGQVASLRVDVMPESITAELVRLQDRVPPQPWAVVESALENELGRPVDAVFAEFDPTPIAAASLGQVHRARDRAGRDLAVKILYPGVERSVAVDLRMLRLALWLFDPLVAPDLLSLHAQLARSLLREMDYQAEGRAAERVAAGLAGDEKLKAQIRVPAICWETTTRRVLTMEFIEGDKINDRAALEARGVDVSDRVAWATRAFLHQMFRERFFHCDPHPGNLLVDREGRVAIVDFGMHEEIEPEIMEGVRMNVLAAVTRNETLWVDSLIRVGILRERDREAARSLARVSFDPAYYNLTPKEVVEIDFNDYFAKVREHLWMIEGARMPDGLLAFGRAFSLLYGLALELAPGMRPLDVVGPYVLAFLQPPRPSPPTALLPSDPRGATA
ncbi:MAG: AarF/ABC1/UbiB kinase family protein [Deltaproteobacteria bacterium]|nr:AarF/ABC1/UbiB kinase family protein [Deltaproteobacteria bacterium]